MTRTTSLFRELSADRRLFIVQEAMGRHKAAKTLYAQRIAAKGRGFRVATLASWPAERIAREVLRIGALTSTDELELLQLLYVDVEPQYQITFLDAAGVRHDNGVLPEDLEPPYAEAEAVAMGAAAVLSQHGENGRHYLRTLVAYNLPAWPGLEKVVDQDGQPG